MFWSLAGGVSIWTFYQILLLWSYANGFISQISFSINPFWFLALFLLIILFESVHFYFVHRLLHFKFFYKFFHHNCPISNHRTKLNIMNFTTYITHTFSCIRSSIMKRFKPHIKWCFNRTIITFKITMMKLMMEMS